METMMKVDLSPEDLAALNEASDEPLEIPTRPLLPQIVWMIRKQIMETLFGPSMNRSFRDRLLTSVSLASINATWAADNFQRVARERSRH
jgi:hypothetical protein